MYKVLSLDPIVSTITLVHVRLKSIEISQYRLDFVFQTILNVYS